MEDIAERPANLPGFIIPAPARTDSVFAQFCWQGLIIRNKIRADQRREVLMITVTISETNGLRKWSHRARTQDALTAIIRTMNKHFPLSHNFILDDVDNAPAQFEALARTPEVTVTGHIWKPMWQRGVLWNVKGSAVIVTLHNSSL